MMQSYKIAGLHVAMEPRYETLVKQSVPYLSPSDGEIDISISIPDPFLRQMQQENPHLSLADCEYICCGYDFCRKLPNFDGFFLHASAVAYEGKAYLFSAPSGTGKSTHTALWQSAFGAENAVIINDDKPAIRLVDGKFMVYGTPFSGKTDRNLNVSVPLQGICVLERGQENEIRQISANEGLFAILNQTIRPQDPAQMNRLLDLLDRLLQNIPVHNMKCNISEQAATLAYQTMKGTDA